MLERRSTFTKTYTDSSAKTSTGTRRHKAHSPGEKLLLYSFPWKNDYWFQDWHDPWSGKPSGVSRVSSVALESGSVEPVRNGSFPDPVCSEGETLRPRIPGRPVEVPVQDQGGSRLYTGYGEETVRHEEP